MIKAVLCIAVCAFSTLISYEMYSKEQCRTKSVDRMRAIVERMIVMLRFGRYDVFQICESTVYEYDIDCNVDFISQWEEICNEFDSNAEDRELFSEVGNVLGNADTQSQIEQLSYIRDELTRSYNAKRAVLDKKRRLYLSLGGLGGLLLCIIII